MMGRRVMAEPLFHRFRIEDHVPENHLLRAVEQVFPPSCLLSAQFDRSRPPWPSHTCRQQLLRYLLG
jgi:hypothetical protein